MRHLLLLVALAALPLRAQYFNHLDLGVSLSSTGLGVELKAPVGQYVDLRAGISYMPRFRFNSEYSILVGGEGSTGLSESRFDKAATMLHDLTGYDVDSQIGMTKQLRLWNFQFLVDVKPIPTYKQFHLTVGFYAGPSRVAKAFNVATEAPSLVAVGMYNSLYERVCLQQPLFAGGGLPAVELDPDQSQRVASYGMMGARLGHFPDGDDAIVVPDRNGQLTSRMLADRFRPYIGVGWETKLGKAKLCSLAVNAGCFFWGGSPRLMVDNVYKVNFQQNGYDLVGWQYTNTATGDTKIAAPYGPRPEATEGRYMHTGELTAQPRTIDMVADIDVTRKDIGGIVNLARRLKVYPVVSITFSRRLF